MKENPAAKETPAKVEDKVEPAQQRPACNIGQTLSSLQKVAATINQIISIRNIDSVTKQALEDIMKFIHKEKDKEDQRKTILEASAKEGAIRKSIKADLVEMYNALSKQLNGIQDTANATVTGLR